MVPPQNAYRVKILSKQFVSAAAGRDPSLRGADAAIAVRAGIMREDEFPRKRDKWRILFGKLRLLLKI